ncbi:MAG TPA: phosphotransferase [Kofleriaceae bacterium]|nr:phosphotransferase [Kofleriaceae bacterium]
MDLEACLPPALRADSPTISKIAAGLSGAGVYRVATADAAYVLKVSSGDEPLADWQRKAHVQALAAAAGVAPRVVHSDEARRAIVSELVVDRGFAPYYGNPASHAAALAQLGQTLRRVHDLPVPADATARDLRPLITMMRDGLAAAGLLPGFARDASQRVLDEAAPAAERPAVLSHNDVNPTNVVFDGERVVLLDWDMAGINDADYDLAAIAVFLRMDEPTCLALLSAHDGAPVTALRPRFAYDRRLVAVACGVIFLHLAHAAGKRAAGAEDTFDATLSLGELYPQMRAGAIDLATGDGRWKMGLALIKESTRL